MAKETTEQKKTVGRVMHEFKHGELETGTGKKVRSRRQAVAIGLKEAGASGQETAAENKRNLSKSKQKERKGKTAQQEKEGKTAMDRPKRSSPNSGSPKGASPKEVSPRRSTGHAGHGAA
jgi:hypothetical protein